MTIVNNHLLKEADVSLPPSNLSRQAPLGIQSINRHHSISVDLQLQRIPEVQKVHGPVTEEEEEKNKKEAEGGIQPVPAHPWPEPRACSQARDSPLFLLLLPFLLFTVLWVEFRAFHMPGKSLCHLGVRVDEGMRIWGRCCFMWAGEHTSGAIPTSVLRARTGFRPEPGLNGP